MAESLMFPTDGLRVIIEPLIVGSELNSRPLLDLVLSISVDHMKTKSLFIEPEVFTSSKCDVHFHR